VPTLLVAATALLAGFSLPSRAANIGAPECLARTTSLADGMKYTNVCGSLIHVGKCTSAGSGRDAWSCDYVMYSPGDSFSVAGDQKIMIRACRLEFGNCVRAVRCIPTAARAPETSVIAAGRKCGIDF
jgi:hypothetical protein